MMDTGLSGELSNYVLNCFCLGVIGLPLGLFIRARRKRWDGERHWFFAPLKKKRG